MRRTFAAVIAVWLCACRSNLAPSFSVTGGVWTGYPDCRVCVELLGEDCGKPASQDIQLQMTTTMCVDVALGLDATQEVMRSAIIDHLTSPDGKDYDSERVYGCISPRFPTAPRIRPIRV